VPDHPDADVLISRGRLANNNLGVRRAPDLVVGYVARGISKRNHPEGANGDKGIGDNGRPGGQHPASRRRGHGLWKQQVVKPVVVDHVIGYVDVGLGVGVRAAGVERRPCPAF
jgi:hypothetical protein